MPKSSTRKQPKSKSATSKSSGRVTGVVPWSAPNQVAEVKYQTIAGSNINLYHNTAALLGNTNLLSTIVRGNDIGDRIGGAIQLKDVRIRLVLNNKGDRPNVSYRVVLVASTSAGDVDTFSELFRGGTFVAPHLPTNSVLLHDSAFPLNQGSDMLNTTFKERSFLHNFEVSVNRPVTWNAVSALANTNLSCYILPYDAFGTLTTDNIASVASWSVLMSFTDY